MEAKSFKGVVVITPEKIYEGEIEVVRHIVSRGAIVHIRKPKLAIDRLECYCNSLEGDRKSMALHYNHDLSIKLGFGGSHIRLSSIGDSIVRHPRVSVSCHTTQEALIAEKSVAAYYFISPIFNSISKEGYSSAFSREEIVALTSSTQCAVALGGVDYDNLSLLLGFNSIALLGAVWDIRDGVLDVQSSIARFDQIYDRWHELKR